MKRFLLIVLVLGAVAAVAFLNYRLPSALQQQQSAQTIEGEIATVTKGTIMESVSTTGRVLPEKQALVGFETSGRVKEILVTVGQKVKKGEVLARLETGDLEMALAEAQASLQASETDLASAKKPATAKEIAAARAKVASALADYNDKMSGPDENEVISNKATLKTAELTLREAQYAYNQIAYKADIGMTSQATALETASIEYEKAKADYEMAVESPTEVEKLESAATLADAEASLDTLLNEPTAETVATAEVAVAKARIAVEQARVDLQNAELKSPIDGTVIEVSVRVGEVPSESTAIILVDDTKLHVDVATDEIDVGQIEVGQPVSVTLDALGETPLAGVVKSISPATTDSETLLQSAIDTGTSVPTYILSIDLTETNPKLRVGMSASAAIQVKIHEDALLVPNRAVQADSTTGQKYVKKVVLGVPVQTNVTVGLSDDSYTEILSGLSEGDKIVLSSTTTKSTTSTSNQGGGPPPMF